MFRIELAGSIVLFESIFHESTQEIVTGMVLPHENEIVPANISSLCVKLIELRYHLRLKIVANKSLQKLTFFI